MGLMASAGSLAPDQSEQPSSQVRIYPVCYNQARFVVLLADRVAPVQADVARCCLHME
ncbi:hypothetical protein DPMN_068682 [Dreissena polymorpha]|uniref:Uncharacterized protein n=1 Tax=Dreissena polymorpha TaxID=45954 RepID=A0A9D4BTS7_DREPO|nr:hypothetical protein DPMN_068682 [Dreissena polymorpha]